MKKDTNKGFWKENILSLCIILILTTFLISFIVFAVEVINRVDSIKYRTYDIEVQVQQINNKLEKVNDKLEHLDKEVSNISELLWDKHMWK